MREKLLKSCCFRLLSLALISLVAPSWALAQSAAFTYQGRLTDLGSPANNIYEMQFKLFNTQAVGTGEELGLLTRTDVDVSNGVFTVVLDFGESVFDGSERFLEIGIRPAGSTDPYTLLSPRQPITSAPYAVRSVTADSAETAANASLLGGVPSSGFVQNTTAQQLATNFNIGGTGTANILDAATQFNLGGSRILSATGASNLFAGVGAGANNTTGIRNSFFGKDAGLSNTTGGSNTFVGIEAGKLNTTGGFNSFFGDGTGVSNTTGSFNAIFGKGAGNSSSTASGNSFFGTSAGFSNTTGQLNAFFGEGTGSANTTGSGNTFIGRDADFDAANPTGDNNTLVGSNSRVTSGVSNSTAIGAGAVVSASNTVVLGRSADTVQVPGALNISGTFAANILNAGTQFNLGGSRILSTPGSLNLFAGVGAGASNPSGGGNSLFGINAGNATTTGIRNSFFGAMAGLSNTTGGSNTFAGIEAGKLNTTGGFNTFIGDGTGVNNTTGSQNTFIGANAGNPNTSTQVTNSVAIGSGATVSTSNTIVLGTNAQTTRIPGKLTMGGGPVIGGADVVAESFTSSVFFGIFTGNLVLQGPALNNVLSSTVHLCIRGLSLGNGFGGEALSRCVSTLSSTRYKTAMEPFSGGLDVINRLKPVTFTWKEGGARDLGLSAEEVAEVEPLLVSRNEKGEVEDVKHENMIVVFINAFKQQQQQIEKQQAQIDLLKKIVCLDHPDADICKPAK